MARLIDADDALERLKKAEQEMKVVSIVGYKAVPMDGVIEFLITRPTVDAVEVVHGQWLKVKDGFDIDRGWKCSRCNNYVYAMTYEPYEYCPHCGAKMDGDWNG